MRLAFWRFASFRQQIRSTMLHSDRVIWISSVFELLFKKEITISWMQIAFWCAPDFSSGCLSVCLSAYPRPDSGVKGSSYFFLVKSVHLFVFIRHKSISRLYPNLNHKAPTLWRCQPIEIWFVNLLQNKLLRSLFAEQKLHCVTDDRRSKTFAFSKSSI